MSPKLVKFVDQLPMLETLQPFKGSYLEISMEAFYQKLHRDLPRTRVWGYNKSFPGPVIDVNQGEPVQIKWENQLPANHLLPVDTSIHGVDGIPEVRTVTHLHGGETHSDSDGYPEAWFTRDYRETGPFFEREVYEYSNSQRAATLWYHDHAMGITRLNMYAGLAGMYIIRGKEEERLNLPEGKYEIPLLIQDRSFNNDGSLFYPQQPDPPEPGLPDPSIVPFFLGDTIVVNGKVWPYLEVEPRKYRFRVLNGSNTRGYQLYLDSGEPFYQIGSDGGLLAKTVKMDQLALEPAERVDLIIDFSGLEGEKIVVKNNLGPNADPDDETDDVMQFRVNQQRSGSDKSRIPRNLSHIPSLKNNHVTAMRNLKLLGSTDEFGRPLLLLDNKKWHDPVTEKPLLDTTEVWSFMNITNFTHPIHIHLIEFQVLDRQPFDLDKYNETGEIVFTGSAVPPEANERGWKDTVAAPSAMFTRVIVHFSPYAGRYVWHCHILEHEDHDMMRPMDVIDPADEKWNTEK